MKKTLCILLVALLYQSQATSQKLPAILEKGWKRIHVSDFGYFDLPPTMEIQKGKYKENIDLIKGITTYETSYLEAKAKKPLKGTTAKHALLILNNTLGDAGEYRKLPSGLNATSERDIESLNKLEKKRLTSDPGLKLIEYHAMKIDQINGVSCMHYHYVQQPNGKPSERIHVYVFHNNDRVHQLNLHYNVSESNIWKNDFAKIIDSFTITNIR